MSTQALALFAIVALGAGASCVLTALLHACAHLVLSRPRIASVGRPGITVLKPLKGVDAGLYENLASIVDQDYDGPYEILLGTADPDDPALEVARRLVRDFPAHAIRIVAGHGEVGANPKVANLAALSRHARYDAWLVSDSNVRVERRYLRHLADELADPRVGVVSNLVVGVGDGGSGARLENLHLNSFVAGAVCLSEVAAQHPVVIGKSMLVRRKALARVGGWRSVADVLGEDYVLGKAVAEAGFRVVLSPHVVRTVHEAWPLQRFVSRHLRWAQVRRSISPVVYALEILLNPLPWWFALAVVGAACLPAAAFGGLVGGLGVLAIGKVLLDGLLASRLGAGPQSLGDLLAIPVKDGFMLGLWVIAWTRDHVEWRGQRLRIGAGSRLVGPPSDDPLAPWSPTAEARSARPFARASDRR